MEAVIEHTARRWRGGFAHDIEHARIAALILTLDRPAHGIAAGHVVRREQAISTDSLARAESEHEYGRAAPVEVVVKPFARVVGEDLCDGRICGVLRRLVVD